MSKTQDLAIERIGLPPDALTGQVAVISGAGRGIGREMARAFAWLGARVVIAEISEEGRDTEQLVCSCGGQALFVQTDVSSPESVARLVKSTHDRFGPADILINNAILCPTGSVLDMPVELWDRVIAVNLRGTFLMCKAFLPELLERGSGTILNLVSTDAMPNLSAYIASKQGIQAFSQSLAGEVGASRVRVVAFAPGFVDTPGLRSAAHGLAPQFGLSEEEFMRIPFHPAYAGRSMPAEDAAAAAAYLAVRLAGEYHGEVVTGYTVLERAGFIQPASATAVPASGAAAGASAGGGSAVPGPFKAADPAVQDRAKAISQALELSQQLQEILAETDAQFNRFPIFIRPLARNGFKGKAGLSLQDWKQKVDLLAGQLARPESDNCLQASTAGLKELLDRLAVYYQEEPAELERFTKDPQALEQARQIAAKRVSVIQSLCVAIDMILKS